MSAKVILNVDYINGSVLPDMKVKPFAKGILEQSLESAEATEVSLGSELLVTAFRYYVKAMGLHTGHVVINYKKGMQGVVIDGDGMSNHVPEDGTVLEEMLMTLL